MIIVIGRGHSGTRTIAQTLFTSNVYMGATVNSACDLISPDVDIEELNILLRTIGYNILRRSETEWDFGAPNNMSVPTRARLILGEYLQGVLNHEGLSGFKIPQLTLLYPWLLKLYPDAKYIHMVRDPRDAILGNHGGGGNLGRIGIPDVTSKNIQYRRAVSYKYHFDIVDQSPRPNNWIAIRFEDFVLRQEQELSKLEDYLDMKLSRIIVRPESVGRWKQAPKEDYDFDFLGSIIKRYSY